MHSFPIEDPARSITDRYFAAGEPAEWLIDELEEFYEGDTDAVDRLLESLEDRWDALDASLVSDTDVIAVEVNVYGAGGIETVAFNKLPHPVEVLWLLCTYAEAGDRVEVVHHRLASVDAANLTWPFSIDDAIIVTSPDLRAATAEAAYLQVPGRSRRTKVAAVAAVAVAAAIWRATRR